MAVSVCVVHLTVFTAGVHSVRDESAVSTMCMPRTVLFSEGCLESVHSVLNHTGAAHQP